MDDVLNKLWEVFEAICDEAIAEAHSENPDEGALGALVHVSSHAATNYEYHSLRG